MLRNDIDRMDELSESINEQIGVAKTENEHENGKHQEDKKSLYEIIFKHPLVEDAYAVWTTLSGIKKLAVETACVYFVYLFVGGTDFIGKFIVWLSERTANSVQTLNTNECFLTVVETGMDYLHHGFSSIEGRCMTNFPPEWIGPVFWVMVTSILLSISVHIYQKKK